MRIPWGVFWQKSRGRLKSAWLVTVGLVAVYLGAIEPMSTLRGISQEKGTGLATEEWEPSAMWHQMRPLHAMFQRSTTEGVVGGVPGGIRAGYQGVSVDMASVGSLPASLAPRRSEDRKTIRNSSMDLIVKNPRDASEKIRQLADRTGGFLVTSEIYGDQDASSSSLQIRVPTNRFEEVRAEIRKLGLRVENEKLQAEDVTKQYVDQSARLRNLHAQEAQYLGILKQAKTVKDTLEVSDKLNEVRGEIEQQQAEFEALSKQVETVALSISLRAEADAQVLGLHWRPLYQLKIAAREGIDGIGDYATAMAGFLFYLPTVLLWLATILFGAAVGWRILRRAGRALFMTRVKAA
jgi:hypothetical protein